MRMSARSAAAVLGSLVLVFAGCAPDPAQPNPTATGTGSATVAPSQTSAAPSADFKVCMVTDRDNFEDHATAQIAHEGMAKAVAEHKLKSEQKASADPKDFTPNLEALVAAKCQLIIAVGFQLADATAAAAKAHPETKFAIIGAMPEGAADLPNLKSVVFNTAESAFLAGYAAAALTKSGTVGAFGAMNLPTVTLYLDGFAQGVAHHNSKHGTTVKLLGWDQATQQGQFVAGAKPFDNPEGAKAIAQNLVSKDADVLFPVAGASGIAALQMASSSNGLIRAIWSGSDGCATVKEYCSSLITSAYVRPDLVVIDLIDAARKDVFSASPYVGTLRNDGTGLVPLSEDPNQVPAQLRAELTELRSQIENGTLVITSAAQPK